MNQTKHAQKAIHLCGIRVFVLSVCVAPNGPCRRDQNGDGDMQYENGIGTIVQSLELHRHEHLSLFTSKLHLSAQKTDAEDDKIRSVVANR